MKWNAELYDDKHSFVFQYGESLLELLNAKPCERVLDLGCGTGHLTNDIAKHGASVIGMDASKEMIAKAKYEYPGIDFRVDDAASFRVEEPFDAVFSNAALHWVKRSDEVIKCVFDALKPGGRFVVDMGAKGNIKLMLAAIKQVLEKHGYQFTGTQIPWYFPSLGEYSTKLEAAGFRVTFAAHFDRPTLLQDGREGVYKWLKMFCLPLFEGVDEAELPQLMSEITDLLEPAYNKDGRWYSDYVRLRFVALRER